LSGPRPRRRPPRGLRPAWPSASPWPAGATVLPTPPALRGHVLVRWDLEDGTRALGVLPDPDGPGLTTAERVALRVRNAATVTGRCACGATAGPAPLPGIHHTARMEHEGGCPAHSPAAQSAMRKLARRGSTAR
jgi:hypothetical protein